MRKVVVSIAAGSRPFEGALALIVGERVDTIAYRESGVRVIEKHVLREGVRFTLEVESTVTKPIDEIIRAYRIGVFNTLREYNLVSRDGCQPVFGEVAVRT